MNPAKFLALAESLKHKDEFDIAIALTEMYYKGRTEALQENINDLNKIIAV